MSIAHVDRAGIFVRNFIPNSCLAYRRDVLAGVRHDCEMRIYEDWDFLLEALRERPLLHVPVNSVVIHKSAADAPQNLRRGNTRDDLIVETMLQLYRKHAAPDLATRQARQALMEAAGIRLPLDQF